MSNNDNECSFNVDNLIDLLIKACGYNSTGPIVNVSEETLKILCTRSKEIFLKQPMMLKLEAPLHICGDIHGQYSYLLEIFNLVDFLPKSNYLFLGDYIDRGTQSIETICLLLAYKIKYPTNLFLLRGNHECSSINRIYGFYDECKRRYSVKLWKVFNECFNCLPVAAIIDRKIFCCHAGLSPDLHNLEQIEQIQRPTDIPDQGLLCDLLWADPDEHIKYWNENDAGVSSTFGVNVVSRFLDRHKMDLICRSHQVVENGYEFFGNRQLVTIFSAPNYCGEFDNAGALMTVDQHLTCSFTIFKSRKKQSKQEQSDDVKDNQLTASTNSKTTSPTTFDMEMYKKRLKWADLKYDQLLEDYTLYSLYTEI